MDSLKVLLIVYSNSYKYSRTFFNFQAFEKTCSWLFEFVICLIALKKSNFCNNSSVLLIFSFLNLLNYFDKETRTFSFHTSPATISIYTFYLLKTSKGTLGIYKIKKHIFVMYSTHFIDLKYVIKCNIFSNVTY